MSHTETDASSCVGGTSCPASVSAIMPSATSITPVSTGVAGGDPAHHHLQVLSIDVGIRNLALCCCAMTPGSNLLGSTGADFASRVKIIELDCVDVTAHVDTGVCTKNANRIPLLALTRGLVRALHLYMSSTISAHVPDITHVVIENQPCYKNPHMKSVQIAIFTFFVGFFESMGARNVDICMFQPRDKLSVYSGPPVECTLKSAYGRRKKLSIAYATWMIQTQRPGDKAALDAMLTSRKKDDLADAYLQAVVFLMRKHTKNCISVAKTRAPRKRKKRKPANESKTDKRGGCASTKDKNVVVVDCSA